MKPTVYVETTIFSFYHELRSTPAAIAMREWTRQWWDNHRPKYEVMTSTAVLAELDAGNLPHREEALAMASQIPAVPVEDEIRGIVEVYIERHVMPRNPLGDALHLALASYYKFDYLLMWNCKHLANANKFNHIRRVNTLLGLHIPVLTTPLELMGGE
ncbi:type II toxin-antitoxin system VapC family toxin [Candidatus Poribacteria bacterium]|nr:type II toxin-antitoxin system VapC family toxin [Candidatus Poribacteria bacterium]